VDQAIEAFLVDFLLVHRGREQQTFAQVLKWWDIRCALSHECPADLGKRSVFSGKVL
jgi:hypothetical protein